MPSSICAQSVPCGRKINSAAGSTKCWISHGHATRSTLIFSRVIHFMDSLRGDRVRRRHHYCSAKHCRGRELLALRLRSSACFAARMESVSCSIELELLLIVRCGKRGPRPVAIRDRSEERRVGIESSADIFTLYCYQC